MRVKHMHDIVMCMYIFLYVYVHDSIYACYDIANQECVMETVLILKGIAETALCPQMQQMAS